MYSLTNPKLLFMYAFYLFVTICDWFLTIYFSIHFVFELPVYFFLFVFIRLTANKILTKQLQLIHLSIHSTSFLVASLLLIKISFCSVFFKLPILVTVFIFYIGMACFNYGFWSTLSDFSLNHLIESLTKIFSFIRQLAFLIGLILVFFSSELLFLLFIPILCFFLFMYFLMKLDKGPILIPEKEKWNMRLLKNPPYILLFVILSISSIDYYFIYFLVLKNQFSTGHYILCIAMNALAIYLANLWTEKVNHLRLIYLLLPFIVGYVSLMIVNTLYSFLVVNFIVSFTFVLIMHVLMNRINVEERIDYSSLNELAMLFGVIFIGVGILFFSITTVFTCLLIINLVIIFCINQKNRLIC